MDQPRGCDALDLAVRQVQGIEAWVDEQRALAVGEVVARSREMRLDAERRLQARRREQQAVLARADDHLRASGQLLVSAVRVRAVVAHRRPWLRERVVHELEDAGVSVVGAYDDGADAVGAVVVEQPELLLVEDRLPSVSGLDVACRARVLAPHTVVGVHAGDDVPSATAQATGARVVFPRTVPPALMAEALLHLLPGGTPGDRPRAAPRAEQTAGQR